MVNKNTIKEVYSKDIFLVSLKDIFTCNMPLIKNLTDNKKTNYSINTIEAVEDILKGLTESQKLHLLEKLAMKIRKANSVKINKDVEVTKRKYPKT